MPGASALEAVLRASEALAEALAEGNESAWLAASTRRGRALAALRSSGASLAEEDLVHLKRLDVELLDAARRALEDTASELRELSELRRRATRLRTEPEPRFVDRQA